jgi:hypothetical protein
LTRSPAWQSAAGCRHLDAPSTGRARLGELWRNYRGRLFYGMGLDFSEAAGYYGLFKAMSIFVFLHHRRGTVI